MIGKLKGIVDSLYEDHAIIDVAGVGYMVFCSSKTLATLEEKKPCELLIDTHVREDHIHLFGFKTAEEKASFLILQSVSGIGTRMAVTILSHMAPENLQAAVDGKDKDAFRAISGIGPKLAERMIVELKGKVFSSHSSGQIMSNNCGNEISNDAISALINLGINRNEVVTLVGNIMKDHPDITIDNLIRLALQKRSKI